MSTILSSMEFWLAAFTFFLFISTFKLWTATEKLVKGAEETAKRQLRAYVGFIRGEINLKESGEALAWIDYQNAGQTPAHDVTLWIETAVLSVTPSEQEFKISGDEGKGGVMVPGSILRRHKLVTDSYLMDALEKDEQRIWVWGEIKYLDVFDEPCCFQFRFWAGKKRDRTDESELQIYWPLIPDLNGTKATYGNNLKSRMDKGLQR
jgi:hypothetical protein